MIDHHELCLLIEQHCPTIDPEYNLPIGTEVEKLATTIIEANSKDRESKIEDLARNMAALRGFTDGDCDWKSYLDLAQLAFR